MLMILVSESLERLKGLIVNVKKTKMMISKEKVRKFKKKRSFLE